ncbi:hypothetical protein [Stagnihabitans tardus]|uniref:Uncharacterized protein n=1 Tax=Stagnihabitans tardus TaxID=2699202 RepID=A0AAE4YA95_9RHOB|nr:hypothetical protein [Stagnihabitans tardus]NBZ86594.1 hypothetical protein [Stagnihabitans tardus]
MEALQGIGPAVAVTGLPVSVEIASTVGSEDHLGRCLALCQRLLAGGDVAWVRVRADGKVVRLVYQRLPAEVCRAVNPRFDLKAPCIRGIPDMGARADLILMREVSGPGKTRPAGAVVWASHVDAVVVWDQRAGSVRLAAGAQVHWLAVEPWFEPAVAAFNGSPATSFRLHRAEGSTARIDPADLLRAIGLRLGPP